MSDETAVLVGILLLAALVLRRYAEKKAHDIVRAIFEKEQNRIIAEYDAARQKTQQPNREQ